MLSFFRGEDITVISKGYGSETDEWGNSIPVQSSRVISGIIRLQSTIGNPDSIVNAYQTVMDTQVSVVLEEGTEILEDDVFIVRGGLWEQDGTPNNLFPEIENRFIPNPVIIKIKQRKGDMK